LTFRLDKTKLRMFNAPKQQRLDQTTTYRGTLAGLLDENGEMLSIGRIVRIENGVIRITTAVEEAPMIVELGAVVLSSKLNEIGYKH
jgi:folate-binding Fe-S cluster repair protein YgfZ